MSVMNSRSLMLNMGLPPAPDRRPRAISLPHPQPIRGRTASSWADLNCSELMKLVRDDNRSYVLAGNRPFCDGHHIDPSHNRAYFVRRCESVHAQIEVPMRPTRTTALV